MCIDLDGRGAAAGAEAGAGNFVLLVVPHPEKVLPLWGTWSQLLCTSLGGRGVREGRERAVVGGGA